jgi:hypothetical protein
LPNILGIEESNSIGLPDEYYGYLRQILKEVNGEFDLYNKWSRFVNGLGGNVQENKCLLGERSWRNFGLSVVADWSGTNGPIMDDIDIAVQAEKNHVAGMILRGTINEFGKDSGWYMGKCKVMVGFDGEIVNFGVSQEILSSQKNTEEGNAKAYGNRMHWLEPESDLSGEIRKYVLGNPLLSTLFFLRESTFSITNKLNELEVKAALFEADCLNMAARKKFFNLLVEDISKTGAIFWDIKLKDGQQAALTLRTFDTGEGNAISVSVLDVKTESEGKSHIRDDGYLSEKERPLLIYNTRDGLGLAAVVNDSVVMNPSNADTLSFPVISQVWDSIRLVEPGEYSRLSMSARRKSSKELWTKISRGNLIDGLLKASGAKGVEITPWNGDWGL